ncbi:AAA family ATPase [Argonema galeatum]|uniref:AAA family ATPase n=1 Tax=Argonema galeatum TaxID=2942762 RepID=UPI002013371A|nr:AAA family ATPase [Argonema galeatum]MCL1464497.1 ATP-binding protein [Argonema galeatum A003/A1]
MRLLRVQVPNFRVLQNVDITFEKDFFPSIFPLGSQNGGGKSTLLQLIFGLLHCSTNPDRVDFLKNLLYGFKIYDHSSERILLIIDILDGEKPIKLEFFICDNSYIGDSIQAIKAGIKDKNGFAFSMEKLENVKNKISDFTKESKQLEKSLSRLEKVKRIENDEQKIIHLKNEITELQKLGLLQESQLGDPLILSFGNSSMPSFEEVQNEIQQRLEYLASNIYQSNTERKQIEQTLKEVLNFLQLNNWLYVCHYSADGDEAEEDILLCRIDNIDITQTESFLKELSQKIFLAAPATQVFLFLSPKSRKLLFREQNEENDYYSQLKDAKSKLTGFFTYDFLAVYLLIESFKAARDKDFRKAIQTGEYGNSYQELIKDLNLLLLNKKINLETDFSGVNFKLDKDDENIELYPEDLSHGELKRLSIYMWLKYYNIENAIVLMDEIEIAFHPDWQYQIISDLKEWAPSNQYILATHSYELCQALTPAHVKELEPKLLKQNPSN